MSLPEFWRNVRVCKRFITPDAAEEDPLDLSPEEIEKALERAIFWLAPAALDGFQETDYFFLAEDERRTLAEHVTRFRAIASGILGAPAKEQSEQALHAFLEIAKILKFDKYADPEAFRIGKEIERKIENFRPPQLADLRFETALDHTGDPGVWIWAILTDDSAEPGVFPAITKKILESLDAASRSVAPDRWPYIQFLTVSEQAEMTEASVP